MAVSGENTSKVLVELVTPEQHFIKEEVDMVTLPGAKGEFGILANHVPMVSLLNPGLVNFYNADHVYKKIFISGGIAEVTDKGVVVLSEQIILPENIDSFFVEEQIKQIDSELLEDPSLTEEIKEIMAKRRKVLIAMLVASTGKLPEHLVS